MKKKFIVLFATLFSAISVFTFAACGDKTQNNDPDDSDEDVTAPSGVENSKLIEDAFGALLDQDSLHLTINNFTANYVSGDPDFADLEPKFMLEGDIYVRKVASGYELFADLDTYTLGASKYEYQVGDQVNKTIFTENTFRSLTAYYVDGEVYSKMQTFRQAVIEGEGYADLTTYLEGGAADSAVIAEGFIDDYESLDSLSGTVGSTRVETIFDFAPGNTIDDAIGLLAEQTPAMQTLGLDSLEDFAGIARRAVSSAAQLADGKTEELEGGGYEISVNADFAAAVNYAVTALSANLNKTVAQFAEGIAGKPAGYVETVIDRLFPADAQDVTINQFIAALETTLKENGINLTVKQILDEVQTISGFTSQQLADVLNPMLAAALPQGVTVTINPREGETLYDTLERSVFDMLGINTVLAMAGGSGEGAEAMTVASLNQTLKSMLCDADTALTLEAALTGIFGESVQTLLAVSISEAAIELDMSLDEESRINALDLSGSTVIAIDYGRIDPEITAEPVTVVDADFTLSAAIAYGDSDAALFAVPAELQPQRLEGSGTLNLFISSRNVEAAEFLAMVNIVPEDGYRCLAFGIYGVEENGLISSLGSNYSVVQSYDGDMLYNVSVSNLNFGTERKLVVYVSVLTPEGALQNYALTLDVQFDYGQTA